MLRLVLEHLKANIQLGRDKLGNYSACAFPMHRTSLLPDNAYCSRRLAPAPLFEPASSRLRSFPMQTMQTYEHLSPPSMSAHSKLLLEPPVSTSIPTRHISFQPHSYQLPMRTSHVVAAVLAPTLGTHLRPATALAEVTFWQPWKPLKLGYKKAIQSHGEGLDLLGGKKKLSKR